MRKQLTSVLMSYARSTLATVLALVMVGVTDPKDLAFALLAALAPVFLRAIDPKDPAFGRLPSVEEFEAALEEAKTHKK